MARSTLLAIMGRMAAYTGQEITWEMALNFLRTSARTVTIGMAGGQDCADRHSRPDTVHLTGGPMRKPRKTRQELPCPSGHGASWWH